MKTSIVNDSANARIEWSIEDIHNLRASLDAERWTDHQAGSFLESISRLIEDRSIEVGWEIITAAMPKRGHQ